MISRLCYLLYIYVHIHIYRCGHRSQTNTQSTHMNINSTNVLILLASPTEQDGAMLLQKYMYSYVQGGSIQQPGSDTQSAQRLPLDSSLPSCCHLDMQVPRASATLQWLVQTLSLTHAPTRTSCCHSQPVCAPALREKYFHT